MNVWVVPILGSSTVVALALLLLWWRKTTSRHIESLQSFQPRILVTGSRGKSSTVRLLHSALQQNGKKPWSRVTGTVTEEISANGEQYFLSRSGQPTVLEFVNTVRRAQKHHSDSLVIECMAVTPELIRLTQTNFIQAQISIVTNVRADHLEDEGITLSEIAHSLSGIAEGAQLVITTDRNQDLIQILSQQAENYGARFIATSGDDVNREILDQLPNQHPDNIACVLAVCAELNIPVESAIAGMKKATTEPFANDPISHQWGFEGKGFQFLSLGTINDPESARAAIEKTSSRLSPDTTKSALIISRWDRPLRSMEFAGLLGIDEFDQIFLAGPLYRVIRHHLHKAGWPKEKIHAFRWIDVRSRKSALRRMAKQTDGKSNIAIFELANIEPAISLRLAQLLKPYSLADGNEFGSNRTKRVAQ